MRTVVIESPYKGDDWSQTKRNVRYAKACVRDCLRRGEAPYASHLFFTQEGLLDDKVMKERQLGIAAGQAIACRLEARVVYTDCGTSKGMEIGILAAFDARQVVEYRTLGPDWDKEPR